MGRRPMITGMTALSEKPQVSFGKMGTPIIGYPATFVPIVSIGPRLLAQNLAGDDDALDLARALADGAELDVAVELFDWIILDETIAAVELYRIVANPYGNLARHQLGHRRLERSLLSRILHD